MGSNQQFQFHYEDISRQDPLLKQNHTNAMEVPGSSSIRVMPKESYDFRRKKLKISYGDSARLEIDIDKGFDRKVLSIQSMFGVK
ncbi:hypothetical protein IC582_028155 [Cucumis melo]